jgi:uncharacterized repeat protein (TIGR01451 family)
MRRYDACGVGTMNGFRIRRSYAVAFALLGIFPMSLAAGASAGPCFGNNLLYAISGANTTVTTINPQNGFATAAVGTDSFASDAAARSPLNGFIYYVSTTTPLKLGSYNPATNTAGPTVALSGLNAGDTVFVRSAFAESGVLYIGTNSSTTIYTVNTATGVATPIPVTGFTTGSGDMAFDAAVPNQYYAIAANGTTFNVFKVVMTPNATNPTAATATLLGTTGTTNKNLFGLAYGNNGVLYALANETTGGSELYTVSTTSGAATQVATVTIAGGSNDLAAMPEPEITDLGVVKTHTTNPVFPGNPITYSLAVTNHGGAASCSLTSFSLADVLPATLSGATYTPSTGTYDSATGLWSGLTFAPGNVVTLSITANVANAASGSIVNTGTVSPQAGTPGVPDSNAANNSSTDTATVTPLANLTVTKSAPANAALNGLIAYSILVSNAGPSPGDGSKISDPIPSNLTIEGAPSCAVTSGAAVCGAVSVAGQNVTSTITTLPSGASVTFSVNVKPTVTASYTNTATVAPPAGTTDQNPLTSAATTVVTTTSGFTKTVKDITSGETTGVGADNGKPGDTLEYDLSFTNTTGTSLTNFVVNDPTPANTTFVSASCGALPAGITACNITSPAVGAAGAVRYTYTGTLANNAVATFVLDVKIN